MSDTDDSQASPLNVNRASIDELMELDQIGRSRATAIMQLREENGGQITMSTLKGTDLTATASIMDKLESNGVIEFGEPTEDSSEESAVEELRKKYEQREKEEDFRRQMEEMKLKTKCAQLEMQSAFELDLNRMRQQLMEEQMKNRVMSEMAETTGMGGGFTNKAMGAFVDRLAPQGIYNKEKRRDDKEQRLPLPKMATFDGKVEWRPFLAQFNRIAHRYKWSEDLKLDKLIEALRDKALKFYSTCSPAIQDSYPKLVDKLTSRFGRREPAHTLRRRLQELRQDENTVEEFGECIQELVLGGYPDATDEIAETIAVDTFLKGLENKRAALMAMDRNPTSLDEAMQLVKDSIHNQRLVMGHKRGEVRKVHFKEDEDTCSDEEPKIRLVQSTPRVEKLEDEVQQLKAEVATLNVKVDKVLTLLTRSRSPSPRSAPMNNNKCFNCGAEGHYSRDCPQRRRPSSPSPVTATTITKTNQIRMYSNCENPSNLVIDIMINSTPVEAVVDTAAQVTVISRSFAQQMRPPIQMGDTVTLTGAERHSSMEARVAQNINIQVGGRSVTWPVLVADISDEVILGLDFLEAMKANINLHNLSLTIGGQIIMAKMMKSKGETIKVARVILKKKTVVGPFEAVQTIGQLSDTIDGDVMMRPADDLKGLCSPYELVNGKGKDVPIMLRNLSPKYITLKKDHALGTAIEVDVVPDTDTEVQSTTDSDELPSHLIDMWERAKTGKTEYECREIKQLLVQFQDAFSKDDMDLGSFKGITHKIDTGSAKPVRAKMRRTPLGFAKEEETHINTMLNKGVIVPSSSEWASAPVLVRKKDGSVRYCIDFRAVNSLCVKDAFPIPNLDECLDTLSGCKYMSTLDMAAGYWQIEVDPADRHKLAFITRYGLFEFVRMPFGTSNSPATFQRVIQLVLQGLNWRECLAYLDDVIVFGMTFNEHIGNLRKVLTRFRQHNLKLKPRKCELFRTEVAFLGKVVSEDGIAVNPESIDAVRTWPIPRSKRDVESFLGFVNYHREHLKGFAEVASPLYNLTGKNAKFKWGQEYQTAFESLKTSMIKPPVLGYPKPNDAFILDTDASDIALGAELIQIQNGVERVISFGSKILTPAQRKYCTTRKELLSLVVFTRQYRVYLLGRSFIIRTDHNSLTWLLRFKAIEGQLARWLEELAQYDMKIQHRAGKKHANADGLSRQSEHLDNPCDCYQAGVKLTSLPCGGCPYCTRLHRQWGRFEHDVDDVIPLAVREIGEPADVNDGVPDDNVTTDTPNWLMTMASHDVRQAQLDDPDLGPIVRWLEGHTTPTDGILYLSSPVTKKWWIKRPNLVIKQGCLYYKREKNGESTQQLVVPTQLQKEIIANCHDTKLASHMGQQKTIERVKNRYTWSGCSRDCIEYVKTCGRCNSMKKPNRKAKAGLGEFHAGLPLERVHIDILGPFPESKDKNKYILVIVDQFTKWLECFAIPVQTALVTARTLVEGFISRLGCPLQIHSDQGRNFESGLFADLCRLLEIAKTRTTPYRPCSNGQVERYNRTIVQAIRCYLKNNSHQNEWDRYLPQIAGAIRATVNRNTGFTPNRMMLGREVLLPIDIMIGGKINWESEASNEEYVKQLEESMKTCHATAREQLKMVQRRQKKDYDLKLYQREYEVGDLVYLIDSSSKIGLCKKLKPPWLGPFIVVNKLSPILYRIKNRKKETVVHHDRLKLCEDRDVPGWLKRMRHNVITSETALVDSRPTPADKQRSSLDTTTENDDVPYEDMDIDDLFYGGQQDTDPDATLPYCLGDNSHMTEIVYRDEPVADTLQTILIDELQHETHTEPVNLAEVQGCPELTKKGRTRRQPSRLDDYDLY